MNMQLQCSKSIMWCTIALLSLSILAQTQNCPLVSPNCQANSCAYTATGALNCSVCNTNAFGTPLVVNGVDYIENGEYVYTCELCSTALANCISCSYDPVATAGIMCSTCSSGYAVVYSSSNGPAQSSCVACQTGCTSCSANNGPVSACGAGVPYSYCGTNGIVCDVCATNYANVNGNCYSCLTPTTTLEDPSTGDKQFSIGLLIWAVSTTISTIALIVVLLYVMKRNKKGEQQRPLNGQIEITTI